MANKDYIIRHCLIIVESKEADQTELSAQKKYHCLVPVFFQFLCN